MWPLAFVALARSRLPTGRVARLLAGARASPSMVAMFWLHAGGPGPVDLLGGVDRVNFLYLSTFTRAGGLLLGAAAAFVWRPWRAPRRRRRPRPACSTSPAARRSALLGVHRRGRPC